MKMEAALKHSSISKRSGLLKHQLQLVKRKDCVDERYEIAPIPDSLSFEKGFFLFIRAMQLLTQKTEGVIFVGLAGPSGAGKTVFTEKVSNFMPGIAMISMDNYNDASRLVDGNYDDPRLTDYDTLLENIRCLKEGRPAEVPIYDFKTSKRVGYKTVDVPASRVVIIEGIYALSERLRPLLDLRVSVTGGVHFDLVKRVLRDINRSGQAPQDIIHQISETVYPMYKAFIEPDLQTAQIRIVNKFNPFSGFQSATYILKSARVVTEEEIRAVLSEDHTMTTEETYDIYLLPPNEDPETCQSYLRMRNRDGKYSLMFEEWVTDNPFIISPRITFEVSVRLLGGLMALGYEMATILKRTSHVFADDKVVVKIDKLEQLQRRYIQVQGKDRITVGEVAKKLGLDGTYIPRSYIEQIQLEKLTAEVTALPDDLREKLSINENTISSPMPSFSWISDVKPGARNLYSRSLSWTRDVFKDMNKSVTENSTEPEPPRPSRLMVKPTPIRSDSNKQRNFEDRGPDSPASFADQNYQKIAEQLAGLNERLDELFSRLGELETKFPASGNVARTNSFVSTSNAHAVGSFGSNGVHCNGGVPNGVVTTSISPSPLESTLVEEVKILARGQRHITTQLDVLSNIVRDNLVHPNQQKQKAYETKRRGRLDGLLGNMKTSETGFATVAVVIAVGFCTVTAVIAARTLKSRAQ
ncbi:uridine kinase [Marchantia polymorpha subsp. ruderalis]|uniref:CYTH domain-containing protein n=1 Tax=Marchantia polymorpha TaxID=3197 RepID=A0A2R6X8K2_MARPO|nr:hypothetical protein MARPO_0030s0147 [Marchantia polymorpha]BBN20313.1 hypothetical protein Mp_8g18140 [Marchantia polymorpha subsp. ruderalis]|eukprot:PTQ42432.1 hypothetical protein MARPO_0030s0147 [Marchantia polymorpha]